MISAKAKTLLLTICAVLVSSVAMAQGTVTVEILSPTDSQSFLLGDSVVLSYSYNTDGTAGSPVVTCTLDGAPSPVGGETRADLAAGQHTYSVSVDDGGVVGSDTVTFTVAAPIPLGVEIASPLADSVFAYGAPVTFDYNLTYEPTLGEPVVATLLDGAAGPADGAVATDLLPGTHTYEVSADQGGTLATDSVSFTVGSSVGKVTAGGWILGPNKDSFGLVAQNQVTRKKATLKGNLTFQDHVALVNVKSTTITGLGIVGNTAVVLGVCRVNGEPGHLFTVAVASVANGKKKAHTFSIALDNGYAASGTLKGGSITIHKTK